MEEERVSEEDAGTRSRSCVLCDEIVEEILSSSSSKTLMKFKAVCKNWNRLITHSSYFHHLHAQKSLQRKLPNLLLFSNYISDNPIHRYVRPLTTVSLITGDVLDRWDIPITRPADQRKIKSTILLPSQCGPRNVICFLVDWERVILCNPGVRKIMDLPPKPPALKPVNAWGFCYLPRRSRYAMVMADDTANKWHVTTFSIDRDELVLEDLWKPLSNTTSCKVKSLFCEGGLANGVLHWMGYNEREGTHGQPSLLCLDLYEETFFAVDLLDEMEWPFWVRDVNGDHLYVITLRWTGEYDINYPTRSTFWKLDQDRRWIKQYIVPSSLHSKIAPLVIEQGTGDMLVYDGEFVRWVSRLEKQQCHRKFDKIRIGKGEFIGWSTQLHYDTLSLNR